MDGEVAPGPRNWFPGQTLYRFRKAPLEFLTGLAREYGDVARFRVGGRNYYLINHPEYIREMLVSEAHRFTKGPALQRAKITLGEGLLTSEGELHKRQRRLAQPAFHAQRVAAYGESMVEQAVKMRERWVEGQVIDVHREMMELTLLVVADALFGADVGEDARVLGEAMSASVAMFSRAMLPWGPLLALLPLPGNIRYWRGRALIMDRIGRMVEQRRNSGEERADFLSILLRARDEEDKTGMSDQQLRDELVTIFMAGHETTANALTFTWHLLGMHEPARRKLREEVERVLGDRTPTADDLPELAYARMVLAESMRLYPPAWTIGRRAIEDWHVGGYRIPRGSVLLASQWVMHRDGRYWKNPEEFRPERWREKEDRPKYAYFPFGGGSRQCIGEAFAWMEATLLLVTLFQKWQLLPTGVGAVELMPTITLRPRGALNMVVRRTRLEVPIEGSAAYDQETEVRA